MKIQERMKEMKDDAVTAKLSSGLDKAERDRDRLKMENDSLRARVSDADDERSRLLDSLQTVSKRSGSAPKRHRLRRTLVLATAAGSAYVLGSKAGRERYEDLKERWRGLTSKLQGGAVDGTWESDAPASVLPTSDPGSGNGA
ncbi:MAG: hypothetical protein ABI572_11120 [Actinomycetota bacterium]